MSKCQYQPLFGRVIIERVVLDKIGSIQLPDHLKKRHARSEGVVIAKGPSADESIKIGQHVIFGKHAGTWLDNTYSSATTVQGHPGLRDNGDGTLFLCQDEDILAIVNGEKA